MSYSTGGAGGFGLNLGDDSQAFQNETNFQNQQYDVNAKRGVDAAIRGGVGDMMANGGSTYYQPPQQAGAASSYQPPLMPVGPPTPGNGPAMTTPKMSYPTSGAPLGAVPGDNSHISAIEAPPPGASPTNQYGYGGKYQFGEDALTDIGAYKPGQGGVTTGQNTWSGQITLPGRPPMSPQQFFGDSGAQDQAMDMRRQWLGDWMRSTGLDAHFGQTIDGVTLTPENAVALAHFAGPTNFSRWVTSDGNFPFQDGNGISIPAYAQGLANGHFPSATQQPQYASIPQVQNGYGGMLPSATPPGYAGMMGPANPAFNARYDPILARLADAPGGGATALQIMGQQTRYDMGMVKRQDTYAKLMMTALAKGDTTMAQQFAPMAGMNLPPALLQDASAGTRFGQAGLAAERIYGNDKAGASRFVNAYMQTGDFGQAAQMAGPPANNAHMTVQQVYDEATGQLRLYGVQTGGTDVGAVTPITGANGQQITGNVRPSGQLQAAQYRHDNPQPLSPADVARTYSSIYSTNMRDPSVPSADVVAQRTAAQMDAIDPTWRQKMGGVPPPASGGGMQRPAIVPGAATPAHPVQPAAAQQPSGPAAANPSHNAGMPAGLPPAAMARLKEGVVTRFSNGQAWTLQHGQPTQVQPTGASLYPPNYGGI